MTYIRICSKEKAQVFSNTPPSHDHAYPHKKTTKTSTTPHIPITYHTYTNKYKLRIPGT